MDFSRHTNITWALKYSPVAVKERLGSTGWYILWLVGFSKVKCQIRRYQLPRHATLPSKSEIVISSFKHFEVSFWANNDRQWRKQRVCWGQKIYVSIQSYSSSGKVCRRKEWRSVCDASEGVSTYIPWSTPTYHVGRSRSELSLAFVNVYCHLLSVYPVESRTLKVRTKSFFWKVLTKSLSIITIGWRTVGKTVEKTFTCPRGRCHCRQFGVKRARAWAQTKEMLVNKAGNDERSIDR